MREKGCCMFYFSSRGCFRSRIFSLDSQIFYCFCALRESTTNRAKNHKIMHYDRWMQMRAILFYEFSRLSLIGYCHCFRENWFSWERKWDDEINEKCIKSEVFPFQIIYYINSWNNVENETFSSCFDKSHQESHKRVHKRTFINR
jgi:hypothetical protein